MKQSRLNAIVGNDRVKKLIIQNAIVANKEKLPFPNTMIIGQSGCGKTTLAEALEEMMEVKLYKVHGKTLSSDKKTMNQLLLNLRTKKGAMLFIDEVHQLTPAAQEALFPLLDQKQTTFIAATTDPGMLLEPFNNRFSLKITISAYDFKQSKEIVKQYAWAKNYIITKRAIWEIARRSHGVARNMVNLTDLCYKKARFIALTTSELMNESADSQTIINYASVKAVSEDLEIDSRGLTRHEYEILRVLDENKTLSLKNLVSMTSIDLSQYEKRYEPILLKMGFIEKSSTGRRITEKGSLYYRGNKNKLNSE